MLEHAFPYLGSDSYLTDTVDGQNIQTLRKRLDWHPRPQMSMLNNVCMTCHAVGFDFFCPSVSTLGRRKQLWNLGGAQGIQLSRVWIFCPSTICPRSVFYCVFSQGSLFIHDILFLLKKEQSMREDHCWTMLTSMFSKWFEQGSWNYYPFWGAQTWCKW